ncbi:uncharacterized protein LOC126903163 isoform X2 [Daktulosphaira vitifoliae]|uniref:uncharacterized protein LOC126903163 isoform X2 n=1 Tax=Daktulosphaira vitifoliae TaxID=58002 RepID=UPI0021AA6568|nr:uncharacterized protein LOC126903163 isoform X2 [Daktulosphaira vitifoliae]
MCSNVHHLQTAVELVPCSNCPKEPAIAFCNVCGNTFCEKCQDNDENLQKRWCICPEKRQNSTPNIAKHEISTIDNLYNFLFGGL